MREVIIEKRGDFWFDLGILQLAYLLEQSVMSDEEFLDDIRLEADALHLQINDDEELLNFLTGIIETIALKEYLLYEKEDKKLGRKVYNKKPVIPLQNAKNDTDGNARLKEKLYDENQRLPILQAVFQPAPIPEKQQRTCVVCQEFFDYQLASKLKINELKLAVHPLATKNSSISHIRTIIHQGAEKEHNTPYLKNICPTCYLLGTLQYSNFSMIYHTDTKKGMGYLLFPVLHDLAKGYDLLLICKSILDSSKGFINLKLETKQIPLGLYSTMLFFLDQVLHISGLEEEEAVEERNVRYEQLFTQFPEWLAIRLGTGQLKNPTLEELPLQSHLRHLFADKELSLLTFFENVFIRKADSKSASGALDHDARKELLETLAEGIFTNRYSLWSQALKKQAKAEVLINQAALQMLDQILWKWRFERMGLPKALLEIVRKVGQTIARLANQTDSPRKSLLYSMEKVRTKGDMLKLLAEVAKAVYESKKKSKQEEEQAYLATNALQKLAEILASEEIEGLKLDQKALEEIKHTMMVYGFIKASNKVVKKDKEEEQDEGN